ncbi:S4 domain-containing protein YaaA [Aerococcaceae bacterium WGS1372]
MEERVITVRDGYITLGQLLKAVDIIQSGGMAKWYLSEYYVFVNEEEEQRRGRKLRNGDVIEFPNEDLRIQIK